MAGNSLSLVWDLIARDGASPAFNRVSAAADKTAASTEAASAKTAASLSKMAAVGAAAGLAFAVGATKMAADFQKQMLLIQTQAGASAAEVRKMTPAVLSLAGKVAQAPEALATSLYHVESTGLRGAAALNAVKIAAEGAQVGHADLEQTTNALTATIASGMLPATESYAQAMGQLNTIVGSGDMKMSDLNEALASGLLVTTKQYGVTLNDVGAALADFGDNNVRGADAATMLRMAVQAIAKPGKEAKGALGEIGLTVQQLQSDEQTGGLNKALIDLHTHLVNSGIDASKWGELLTTAFTKKAGTGLLTLIGTFDRFQQKYKEVAAGAGSFGDAWAATTKTAAFQANALKDNIEAMAISTGQHLLPAATATMGFLNRDAIPAIEHTASAVGAAVHWFSELPAPIRDTALALGALALANKVGIFGALESGGGRIMTGLRGITSGIKGAATSMSGLKAAGTGLMNFFGGPWVIATAGAALGIMAIKSAIDQHDAAVRQATQDVQAWNKALALGAGGQSAIDAQHHLDDLRQKIADLQAQLKSGSVSLAALHVGGASAEIESARNKISDLTTELNKGQKAWDAQLAAMSPVERATARVQIATQDLNNAMRDNPPNSQAVANASGRLADAQSALAYQTGLANDAAKTQLQRLQDLANAQLGAVSAGLAAKQSYDQFVETLNQYRNSTQHSAVETDGLAQAAIGSAAAAGQAGEAWAKANHVSDTAAASNYAQLLALEKVANAMGTDTPLAVSQQIIALQRAVAQGGLTAAQMDAITRSILGIPKDPHINVSADTKAAQDAIDALLRGYQHVQYTGSSIVVNGRVIANADGNLLPMSATQASVVRPGALRVIGDNPVSDEAFIPINSSPRSMSILGETASRMGMGLVPMAAGGFWNIGENFPAQPSQSMLDSVKAAGSVLFPAFSGGGGGAGSPFIRLLGASIAASMGYGSQFNAIDYIFSHESGWNPMAQNPTSTAFGIPQFLNSTWGAYGGKTTDAGQQIRDGISYMRDRYGSPNAAAAFWQAHHWYRNGTNYVPSDQLAMLHKGEAVVPASQNQGAPYVPNGPQVNFTYNGPVVTQDMEELARQNAKKTRRVMAAYGVRG